MILTVLLYAAICALEGLIIGFEVSLWRMIDRYWEDKITRRRQKYREKAYKQKSKEAVIAENRKKLWRFIK